MPGKDATTIMGLDPAITRTGIARWRDGKLSTMTVATNPKQDIEARMRWICGHIWPLITRRTFVVLEAPYVTSNGATSMMLAGLHYVIRYGLYARNVEFGVVAPSQLKVLACGQGGASKEEMVNQATAEYGPGADLRMGYWQRDLSLSTDDVSHEADALHCLTAGLHHAYSYGAIDAGYGMEPGMSVDEHTYLQSVSVDWPELEWS